MNLSKKYYNYYFKLQVKKERHDKFIECFEHVANEIDAIYKVNIIQIHLFILLFSVLNDNSHLGIKPCDVGDFTNTYTQTQNN